MVQISVLDSGGVGGSLKNIEQFKKSSGTCKFRQGAKPMLECGFTLNYMALLTCSG